MLLALYKQREYQLQIAYLFTKADLRMTSNRKRYPVSIVYLKITKLGF